MEKSQVTLSYDPNHYVNNDPAWGLLNGATVSLDDKAGEYKAIFPVDLLTQQSRKFTITGFMLPLDPSKRTLHFALVRRNTACPFCPPNNPTEAIEVFSSQMVEYTGDELKVTGRLTLIPSSSQGLFYRLDNAQVTENS
jgi:hypothetical protein